MDYIDNADFLLPGIGRNIFAEATHIRSVSDVGCRSGSGRSSARLRSPDDIRDGQFLRHDPEIVEFIGQALLIGNCSIRDGRDTAEIGAGTRQCNSGHRCRNAGNFG